MPGQYADSYPGNQNIQTAWGPGVVQQCTVNASSNGANTLIAAVPGKKLVVLLGRLGPAAGAVTVTMQSSGGTVLDGPTALAANGGYIYPQSDFGHFATGLSEGLVLNLSGAVQVGGYLLYAIVG
jgi:hypothetical protein